MGFIIALMIIGAGLEVTLLTSIIGMVIFWMSLWTLEE